MQTRTWKDKLKYGDSVMRMNGAEGIPEDSSGKWKPMVTESTDTQMMEHGRNPAWNTDIASFGTITNTYLLHDTQISARSHLILY